MSDKKVRHRKILRDNITGVTKPALKRIIFRGGVTRVNGLCFEELRGVLKIWLENVCRSITIFVEHERRKTIFPDDVAASLKLNGVYICSGAGGDSDTVLPTCSTFTRPSKKGTGKTTRDAKPGAKAARDARFQQLNSDCSAIPQLPFERLVREILQDFEHGFTFRINESALEMIQMAAEDYLVKLIDDCSIIMLSSQVETLSPKIIQTARRVRGERA
jgi:histone H4